MNNTTIIKSPSYLIYEKLLYLNKFKIIFSVLFDKTNQHRDRKSMKSSPSDLISKNAYIDILLNSSDKCTYQITEIFQYLAPANSEPISKK